MARISSENALKAVAEATHALANAKKVSVNISRKNTANQQRVIKNATRRNHGKSVGNSRSALAKAFGWK